MHRLKCFFLVTALAVFPKEITAQNSGDNNGKIVVVIDPGHGGRDSGALSRNGIAEKDITLAIAKQIINVGKSEKSDKMELYLTRYRDTLISLSDRTKLARKLKADVFISLHCNHSDNPNAKGVEVYVSKYKNDITDKAVSLAYLLEKSLSFNIGIKSRGVKFGNFQVLRENRKRVSVLVELGFLSQVDEEVYLSSQIGQRTIALILYKSIVENLGS